MDWSLYLLAQQTFPIVLLVKIFIIKSFTINTFSSSPILSWEVPTMNHKFLNKLGGKDILLNGFPVMDPVPFSPVHNEQFFSCSFREQYLQTILKQFDQPPPSWHPCQRRSVAYWSWRAWQVGWEGHLHYEPGTEYLMSEGVGLKPYC